MTPFGSGVLGVRPKATVLGLALGIAWSTLAAGASDWGWKLATSSADALAFLNGGAYAAPVSEARVAAMWKGGRRQFSIAYRRDAAAGPASSWGLKLATDAGDVHRFVNGIGAYGDPVQEFRVAALWQVDHPEFYVFYRQPGPGDQPVTGWGWRRMSEPTEIVGFLNGDGPSGRPATSVRIAAVAGGPSPEFYVFYQRQFPGPGILNWRWRLTNGVADALNYVRGRPPYPIPAAGFDVAGVFADAQERLYVFANRGEHIWLQSPLKLERFVHGEPLKLAALPVTEVPVRGEDLLWTSDRDGPLGQGATIIVPSLSPGRHTLSVSGAGLSANGQVRVYSDLAHLYRVPPSKAEVERIREEFAFEWFDGTLPDEQWDAYAETFDQSSTEPSKLVLAAKLDVLRHQRFSSPPPFTGGRTVYEYVRAFAPLIRARLSCQPSGNIPGVGIAVSRSLSIWDSRASSTPDAPDACKEPRDDPQLNPYVNALFLLVHEARHNDPDDSGHMSCSGASNMDPSLEEGSGHAQAALYLMWVFEHGSFDPPEIRETARDTAHVLLTSRFCSPPSHSNPSVQAIVDKVLGP